MVPQPKQPIPPATLSLVIVLVVVHLLVSFPADGNMQLWLRHMINGLSATALLDVGANSGAYTTDHHHTWRLLTAVLLHGNIAHLLFNSVSLINVGGQLEGVAGWQELLFAFVATGIVASVFSVVFNAPTAVSVGASGAVFGLVGFVVSVNTGTLQRLQNQLKRNAANLALALLLPALIPNAGHWAHIGGIVSGMVLGFAYRKPAPQVRDAVGYGCGLLLLAAVTLIWRIRP